MQEKKYRDLTYRIIGVYYEVYNELGHGFLESVFGSEFINFTPSSAESLFLATRTGRPRQTRVGLKLEF